MLLEIRIILPWGWWGYRPRGEMREPPGGCSCPTWIWAVPIYVCMYVRIKFIEPCAQDLYTLLYKCYTPIMKSIHTHILFSDPANKAEELDYHSSDGEERQERWPEFWQTSRLSFPDIRHTAIVEPFHTCTGSGADAWRICLHQHVLPRHITAWEGIQWTHQLSRPHTDRHNSRNPEM